MTTDFKTMLPEIIVQKIIQKTISEFENKYLCINYNNEAVYTGLKLKPKILMKKIFSDVFYFLSKFKDEKEQYDEEENFDSKEKIAVTLTEYEINKKSLEIYETQRSYFNEIEKNIFINYLKTILINIEKIEDQNREIFNYINSCFKSLYSCTYEQYIKVLKKKIFLHYGEDTIHHYSYLKKSSITPAMIKLKHFDNSSLKNIFENNNKFYWLYLSLINHIDQIKKDNEDYELIHLKKILQKHGLSNKGWVFLTNQNPHYITRMGQSITWSVFCANYGLKDAWLRNEKHRKLFNHIREISQSSDEGEFELKKLYCSLGKSCSSWKKPVTKFSMLSSYRLKIAVSYFSKITDFIHDVKESLKTQTIDYSNQEYIKNLRTFENYYGSCFLFSFYEEILSYLMHKKEKCLPSEIFFNDDINWIFDSNSYPDLYLDRPNDIFNIGMCHENFKELCPIIYEHLKECPELIVISEDHFLFTYLKLKSQKIIHKKNIYSLLMIKILNDSKIFIENKYNELRERLINKFGKNFLLLANEVDMTRTLTIQEFNLINDDKRVINENKLLFNDFINFVPFSGDSYLRDVKLYLNSNGLNQSGWLHMLKEYKKHKKFSFNKIFNTSVSINYDNNIATKLSFVVEILNLNIPFVYFKFINKYLYKYVLYNYYYQNNYNENYDRNIKVFFSAFFRSFISLVHQNSGKGKLKNEYIFSNIISCSRAKYYLEYIKRNNSANIKDMFERDMNTINDYIVIGCQNEILPQSGLKKLIEKANRWHEDDLMNILKKYEYIEEEIYCVSIDKEYTFIQIKNTEDIVREADEMKHCIRRYNQLCAENKYVAYHMTSTKGESATLGIKKISSGYVYDQLYSFKNRPVSKEARNAAKYLVELLNKKYVNKNNKSSYRIAA